MFAGATFETASNVRVGKKIIIILFIYFLENNCCGENVRCRKYALSNKAAIAAAEVMSLQAVCKESALRRYSHEREETCE